MKKLIIAIFLCVLLIDVKCETSKFSLCDYFSEEITFYTKNDVENSIDVGFCCISTQKDNSVIGESVVLNNYEVGTVISTLKAEVLNSECLDCGTVVIYAFSPLITKKVQVGNCSVNLQIAVRENDVVVGWPLILGSF